MALKPSTKAARLQLKIAYYILSGRKRPASLIANKEWWGYPTQFKVWHIKAEGFKPTVDRTPHCTTCSCHSAKNATTLCNGWEYRPDNWKYKHMYDEDFRGKRPCKRCLASLSKIANGR